MFKKTIILLALLALGGCKLVAMVDSGGRIVSGTGSMGCNSGNVCEFTITSPTFSEAFIAHPNPGYEFISWQGGKTALCADSTNPTCTVSLQGFDQATAEFIVSTFDHSSLRPLFRDIGIDTDEDGIRSELDNDDDNDGILDVDDSCPLDPSPDCSLGVPLTDTVTINGREWAQIDLFQSLSWNEINAVCPGGPCSGVLNGYNMAGMTWASLADVSAIINFYAGASVANLEVGSYLAGPGSEAAPGPFIDGMRPTIQIPIGRELAGLCRDTIDINPTFTWWVSWVDYALSTTSDRVDRHEIHKDFPSDPVGAWFYRTP